MADLSKLLVKVVIDRNGFNSDIDEITAEDGDSAKAFGAWGVTAGNLAARAITKSIRAAMDFLSSVVSTGMDFDKEMSAVKAVAQMTEKEFEAVRQKAIDLGGSTVFTAEEVGEAFYYMGVAGWDAQEMLDGIEGVLNLAAASGENLGTVSDIVTDTLTAMGYKASDTAHFVDVLAAASANSNTTVTKMGESFKYFANVAGIYNYSIDDVAAALGLLANTGVKASTAGTALRRVMINMTSPSEKAEAAMRAFGLSLYDEETDAIKPFMQVMQELRQIMVDSGFDPAGRDMQAYTEKVEELNEQLVLGKIEEEEYTDELNKAKATMTNSGFLELLTDLGGARGLPAMLAIMRSTDEDFSQLVTSIASSEGAAATMSSTMLDNLAGDITLFNSALDNLKIQIFDKFDATLRGFVQTATEFINFLNGTPTTLGGTFDKLNESMEEQLATADSDERAVHSLIDYMNSLAGPTGVAAENLTAWTKAADKLVELCPDMKEYINQTTGEFTAQADEINKVTTAYFNNVRAMAIQTANEKQLAAIAEQEAAIVDKQIDLVELKGRVGYNETTEKLRRMYTSLMQMNAPLSQANVAKFGIPEDVNQWTTKDYQSFYNNIVKSSTTQKELAGLGYNYTPSKLGLNMGGLEDVRLAEAEITGLTNELNAVTEKFNQRVAAQNEYLKNLTSSLENLPDTIDINVNVNGDTSLLDGSHATGLNYVPYDGYIAKLHRGEQIVTATNARRNGGDTDAIVAAVTSAINQSMKSLMGSLKIELNNKAVGKVVGDSVTTRVNNNIGSMQDKIAYGYGG